MIGWFFDILVLLTVVIWLLKLTVDGYLTVKQTALFLVGFVVLLSISRALKIGLGRLVFRVGIPVAALLVFAVSYGQGQMDQIMSILSSVVALLLVLFGIYFMISGLFKKGR